MRANHYNHVGWGEYQMPGSGRYRRFVFLHFLCTGYDVAVLVVVV